MAMTGTNVIAVHVAKGGVLWNVVLKQSLRGLLMDKMLEKKNGSEGKSKVSALSLG